MIAIKRILQISPATTGWFTVHEDQGEALFDAIAFWALCETDEGGTVVIPVNSTHFTEVHPGIFSAVDPVASNLLGVLGPGESQESWAAVAKEAQTKRNTQK
jgi:hypothetical protein